MFSMEKIHIFEPGVLIQKKLMDAIICSSFA